MTAKKEPKWIKHVEEILGYSLCRNSLIYCMKHKTFKSAWDNCPRSQWMVNVVYGFGDRVAKDWCYDNHTIKFYVRQASTYGIRENIEPPNIDEWE